MKRVMHIFLVLALSLTTLPVLAVGEDPLADYEDGYYTGDYGRIRYQENEVTIVRGATGDLPQQEEAATVNSPIYPADSIATYYDQRAEVQLASGTLIRIDADSQAVFQALPDPYAEHPDNAIVQLAYGAMQISARIGDKEEFRIDTPAASVYLLGDGDYRIEVDDDGRTRVLSRRGVAEVVSEGGSVLVRGGMRTTVYAGFVPDDPHSFNTFVMDDFDRWVRDREGTYRTAGRYAQEQTVEPYEDLPTEVRPYYRELSSHGRWVWVPDHGYGWIPVGVSSGWRPYHRGYWDYGPRGYFWVSYEPWGWAPYHYGRWDWMGGYGWVWIPGRVFSGAWVTWSYGPSYIGWCPLGVYNYPVRVGGISFGFYGRNSWTFVSYTNLRHRRVHQYAVRVDHLGDEINRHAVVTRPPKASPRALGGNARSREQEVTLARNNTRDRVPRNVPRNPNATFRDDEREIIQRAAAARPGVKKPADLVRTPGGQSRSPVTTTPPPTAGRPGARPVQTRAAESEPSTPNDGALARPRPAGTRTPSTKASSQRPRQQPGEAAPSGRTPEGTTVRPGAATRAPAVPPGDSGSPSGRAAPSQRDRTRQTQSGDSKERARVQPKADGSRDTGSNVRSMYEETSKPRKTERKEPSASPSTRPSSGRSSSSRKESESKSKSDSDKKKGSSADSRSNKSRDNRSTATTESSDRTNRRSTSASSRSNARGSNRSSSAGSRSSGGGSNRSSSAGSRSSGGGSNRSSGSGRSSGSSKSSGNSKSSGKKGGR